MVPPTKPNNSCNWSPSTAAGTPVHFVAGAEPGRRRRDPPGDESRSVAEIRRVPAGQRLPRLGLPGGLQQNQVVPRAAGPPAAAVRTIGDRPLGGDRHQRPQTATPPEIEALDACKQQLSQQDRDLIERRYQPGATTASVAAEVGRSVAAVYKAVVRIRRDPLPVHRAGIRREQHE